MFKILLVLFLLGLPYQLAAQATQATKPDKTAAAALPQVVLETSQGAITIELYPEKSPKSVANFLQYVRDGFYAGTVLHRVIPGYLVQGGLYTRDLRPKRTRPAIPDEADNGLSNLRGTIAVARGTDPNSGTAQFFFNLVDNLRLDFVGNQSSLTWGFAVFGKITKGMDVLDKIAALPTRALGPFSGDVPNPLVVIESAHVVGEEGDAQDASGTPAKAATAAAQPAPAKSAAKRNGAAKAAAVRQGQ
jgi:peptidyl-prolyl cis-trans isomerase A (cyclophilin A)